MKKLITILAILALTLTLFTACNGKKTNGIVKSNGDGVKNPQVTANGLTFVYKTDSNPKDVFLTGGFNGWRPDDPKFEMKQVKKGVWSITVTLDPGRDEYKFVVNGKLVVDKNAKELEPDGTGGQKSMVTVK